MAANVAAGLNLSELAEQRGVRDCLQWFTREKQWINETHLQLCRVPSPTFLEQERAAWLAEQLRALGWNASRDRSGNVVAADGDGPYVAMTAHLDTVIAPRNKEDISVDARRPLPMAPAFPITARVLPPCWRWRAPGRAA